MYLCVIVGLLSAPGTKDPSMERSEFDDKVRQLLVMGIEEVRPCLVDPNITLPTGQS